MKPSCALRTVAAVIAAAGVSSWAGCTRSGPAMPQTPAPKVTVARPVSRTVTDYFEFPGQTAAVQEVEIRARVTGHIVGVKFEEGQDVKKGDVLFEIDPRPYQAALDRATGDLARLRAVLAKAKADMARGERLRPSGAISEDEHEQHTATLAIANASIQSGEAAVRDAELNLEFTRVIAPIDGRVSYARIKEGNLVQPGAGESTVLTTVVATDPIHVYFCIDDRAFLQYERTSWGSGKDGRPKRIKDLKIPVDVGLVGEDGFKHAGILDFLDNKVDRGTGTIRARAELKNEKGLLTPGLFVRVRLPFGKPHEALMVTERAIGTDQKLKYVLTVDDKKVVHRRDVTVGSKRDGLRVIQSGLAADEWVIVKGIQSARPGQEVNPHRDGEEKKTPAVSAAVAVKEAK